MLTLLQSELQPDEQIEHSLWSYISASRLNLWAKCPLAFRFRYVDNIKLPTNANLFLGQVVHGALEMYYRHRQIGLTPIDDDVDTFVDAAFEQLTEAEQMCWDATDDAIKCRKQAVDLVTMYANEYSGIPETIIAMEASLEAPLVDPSTGEDLGVPLFGIVDLVLSDDLVSDSALLVDFKTASSAMLIEQSHAVQLTLYTLLLQNNGYTHVETEIRQLVKTKTPRICAHRFGQRTEQHTRQFFALCREYLDAIDRNAFNYRPGWSCSMCDYRGLCSV
jgi:hypothetical protein